MKLIIFCLIAIMLVSSTSFASSESTSDKKQNTSSQYKCQGTAQCINGTVIKIVDGDTLWVKEIIDGVKKYKKIRLSLTSTPELKTKEGIEASNFLKKICPIDSKVIVDQDDKQKIDKFKRVLGKVICNGENLNAELLYNNHAKISKQLCSVSEFSTETWAQKYGCATKEVKPQIQKEAPKTSLSKVSQCDASYPEVCIKPYPPDLDCKDMHYKNFRVLPPDPHRFDVDKNGIGCET